MSKRAFPPTERVHQAARRRVLGRATQALLAGSAWLAGLPARAQATAPAEVQAELPGATLRGSGRLTFLGLSVYDARLWTAAGAGLPDPGTTPLALELQYARTLYGRLIAERSLDEMRRQQRLDDGQAERWLQQMKSLFPDVAAGDRITGINRPGEGARFHVNGRLLGEVRDADFARLFFGIWLSPQTSEPRLRQSLLGGPP